MRAQLSPGLVGSFVGHDYSAAPRRRRTGRPLRLRVGERCRARVSGRAARRHGTSPPVGAGIRRTDVGSRRRPRQSSFRDRARVDGRLFTPSLRPATNKSYDEGLEFPCLMSHWRTWSTFTTFKAEIGITIQGFSVT